MLLKRLAGKAGTRTTTLLFDFLLQVFSFPRGARGVWMIGAGWWLQQRLFLQILPLDKDHSQ